MVHVQKRVKHFLLIFCILIECGISSSFIARQQQLFSLYNLAYVLLVPAFQLRLALIFLSDIVELKALEFEIKLILDKLLHSMHIDLIKFGDETSADESVFKSQPDFFAIGENELVQVKQYEFQGFWVGFVDFDDLGDAARVEGLVFYVAEVAKNLLDFILHSIFMKYDKQAEYLSNLAKKKLWIFAQMYRKRSVLFMHAILGAIIFIFNLFDLKIFQLMSIRQVIKSISDKRIYKPLLLKNNLECLVISDKDAQKSAAALSVGVGSFSDPLEAQGLAHYLEHMLFMGTSKYPVENEYSNFLSKNAGASNAYTSLEETNFYFQVSHGAFYDAFDRFSRFFIDPLMLDSSSERELNAVHSEHSKNLQNDMWRKYQLTKHLSKEDHPYHKFSTGDKNSLANPNLREMLFNFYNSSYSANLMKLVVYGQDDIERLAKSVEDQFNEVKDSSFQKFKITSHPFGQKTLQKIVKLVPVKDKRVLELTWFLKNQTPYYRNPPSKYVSHILGHEGKGSLLSFLISQGLATSLSAGGSDSYDCYSEFEVTITLTDKGVAQFKDVISYVFYFIKMLKETQPQAWIVEQIQRVNKMKFDFMDKKQGMSFCSGLAKNLHKRKIQEIYIYPYLMEEFKPELIKDYVQQLGTQNLMVIVESKTFESQCNDIEPIYKSKYTVQPLGTIEPKTCNVSLPEHNFFIPDDLSILPLGESKHPRKIHQSEFLQAFFKEDHQFSLPKAQLDIRIYFDGLNTARDNVIRTLFDKMLTEKLREFAYLAQMADLDSEFSISSYYTMNISVKGFRDSFDRFINSYLEQILQFKPTDRQLFETLKEKQKKEYMNFFLGNPYQLAYDSIINALREGNGISTHEKLAQIEKINLEDVAEWAKAWKNKFYLEVYMTGNTTQAHSLRIVKSIEEFVKKYSTPLPKKYIGTIRPVFLPVGKVCAVEQTLKSKDQTNSSLIVHYQYEATVIKTKILQDLANSFVKEPAFDYLRTKEQLGYIVMCLQDDHRGVLGLSILVQSNIKCSYELQQYVHKFVNQILKEKITSLDEKIFNEYKDSLYNTKIQKDKNLTAESTRFWGEIVKHSYEFTRKEKEIELIPNITLDEFKKFLNGLFYDNPRIFEIHQISQPSIEKSTQMREERVKSEQNFQFYPDVETFRKKMPLYPDYYSHL